MQKRSNETATEAWYRHKRHAAWKKCHTEKEAKARHKVHPAQGMHSTSTRCTVDVYIACQHRGHTYRRSLDRHSKPATTVCQRYKQVYVTWRKCIYAFKTLALAGFQQISINYLHLHYMSECAEHIQHIRPLGYEHVHSCPGHTVLCPGCPVYLSRVPLYRS